MGTDKKYQTIVTDIKELFTETLTKLKCLSSKICPTHRWKRRRKSTSFHVWCLPHTPTSWTSNVRAATKSPPCSVTHRLWFCVCRVVRCCVNLPAAVPDSQRD